MSVVPRNTERDQRIVALRQAGATLREIGRMYGLSHAYVCRICQRAQRREREAVARSHQHKEDGMIEPTQDDIGRKVVYREHGEFLGRKVEEGVITSFNSHVVFVRYGSHTGSAATAREDLEWTSP